jgi:outer membrane receptor protein involved in Fe transport
MLTFNNRTKKFSQELRLTMPLGPYVDWLAGAFYTRERSTYDENLLAENPTTGQIIADGYYLSFPTTFAEYAGFSDVTWHVTPRFDVQVGARESHIEQSKSQTVLAPLFGGTTPSVTPRADASANAFTYLFTPRFKISQDAMVYARVASGYRAGGTNPSPIHPEYGPDKTENYELGFKGDFLDRALSIDASIFRINWHGLQITLLDPQSFSYSENGSGAKSQGVEVSLQARPNKMVTLTSWASYADAELTDNLPALGTSSSTAYGLKGDRLPLSAKVSGSASVDLHRTLWADNEAFAVLTESYVGDRLGNFEGNAITPRYDLPGYAKTDLRVGFRSSSWVVDLYANNICDRRGALAGGDIAPVFAKIYLQPRTVGVSVSKTF